MLNLNETTYPFSSYIPSRFAASILGIFVYLSLIGWFIQCLHLKCRPTFLSILIFVAHLTVFIDLVLRATLAVDVLNTSLLYKIEAPLWSTPARLLLFANYHCLVELRGKKPRGVLDRIIDLIVPLIAITADILLAVANEFSFKSHRLQTSFHLRQASAALILFLALFFYAVWFLAVSEARRLYALPLLAVSSTAVLIEAIYVQAISIPNVFFALNQYEYWFYAGHVIPVVLALIAWSLFHPRRLLPPAEKDVPHDETGRELLPPPPQI